MKKQDLKKKLTLQHEALRLLQTSDEVLGKVVGGGGPVFGTSQTRITSC